MQGSILSVGGMGLLLALAWVSGNRSPVDEVARAAEITGVAFEARHFEIDDIELHVVLAGPEDGPKVILLHGFPEFWYTWHAQMAILARAGFRVAAPDTRGANRSGKPSDAAHYTDQRFVHDVVEILDQLGWQQAYLAGHDVGGGTAWQLAFEAPERFRAAMIFNVPHPLAWENARPEDDAESVSWFRGFFRLPFLPELVSRAGDYWLLSYYLRNTSRPGTFPPEELDVYKSSWAFEQSIGSTINSYRAPATELQGLTPDGRPTIPVRVIWGDKDAFVPLQSSTLSEAYLPKGEIRHWPEASHWLLHEEPERTATAMIEYFGTCCS